MGIDSLAALDEHDLDFGGADCGGMWFGVYKELARLILGTQAQYEVNGALAYAALSGKVGQTLGHLPKEGDADHVEGMLPDGLCVTGDFRN